MSTVVEGAHVPGGHTGPALAWARGAERVPAYVYAFVAAVVLQFMSGSTRLYGIPIPPDRLALLVAIGLLVIHPDLWRSRWRLCGIHLACFLACVGVLGSIVWFSGFTDTEGVFRLVDTFGIVPFLLFATAPLIFGTPQRRFVLLFGLALLGLYLGWTSVAEGLHLRALVWPGGIYDPNDPHFPRAIGPSRQVANNGLQLLGCAAAAAGVFLTRRGMARWVAVLSLVLCLAGAFFTLTRSIWLAALVAILVVAVLDKGMRGRIVAACVVGGGVLLLVVFSVPAVYAQVFERIGTSRSVYDRLNVNEAAIRAVLAHPLEGIGYNRFQLVSRDWVWQAPDYPITSIDIAVHNVFLGHAVELGIPLAMLWVVVLLWAVSLAIRGVRGAPGQADGGVDALDRSDIRAVGTAAAAYVVAWIVVANFIPIGYALPTTLLWLFLGLCVHPRDSGFDPVR